MVFSSLPFSEGRQAQELSYRDALTIHLSSDFGPV